MIFLRKSLDFLFILCPGDRKCLPGPRVKFYPIIIISKEKSNFNSQNVRNFLRKSNFFLLPLYRTKPLKSNFLTPKSYSAPATVKFYTLSNFGRANKLGAASYKQAEKLESWKAPNFRKEKLELHFLKTYFSYL